MFDLLRGVELYFSEDTFWDLFFWLAALVIVLAVVFRRPL